MNFSQRRLTALMFSSTLVLSACDGGSFTPNGSLSGSQIVQSETEVQTEATTDRLQVEATIKAGLETTSTMAALEKPDDGSSVESGLQLLRVAMSDGAELDALVSVPEGPGPFPLVVLPSSWAFNFLEYLVPASEWSDDGYVVISYTSRGFWGSDGLIDLAGPRTVDDFSEIVDWALLNTPSDPNRIGAAGSSYGAGIPILAAAKDNRIKAIAAMSGFTDPSTTFYVNNTAKYQSLLFLYGLAELTGEAEPDFLALVDGALEGDIDPQVVTDISSPRSAILKMDALNRNKPAILQISGWNDSIFIPKQHLDFYRAYEGDISMELRAGDHTVNDAGGFIGLPNINWERSKEWLDHYLKDGPALNQKPLRWSTVNTDRILQGDTLESMAPYKNTYTLVESDSFWPFSNDDDGILSSNDVYPNWDRTITGGVDTGADSGTALVSGTIQGFTNISPLTHLPSLNRKGAAVWRAEAQESRITIAGTPSIKLGVTPSSKDATIVAYLYDEGPLGFSSLITYGAYTVRDVIPGQREEISFDLNTIAWDLEPGHNLVLVIDTDDARYTSETQDDDTVTLNSSSIQPSKLTIPLH